MLAKYSPPDIKGFHFWEMVVIYHERGIKKVPIKTSIFKHSFSGNGLSFFLCHYFFLSMCPSKRDPTKQSSVVKKQEKTLKFKNTHRDNNLVREEMGTPAKFGIPMGIPWSFLFQNCVQYCRPLATCRCCEKRVGYINTNHLDHLRSCCLQLW